jgi:hypothetical protein
MAAGAALAADPSNTALRVHYASLLIDVGRPDEALAHCRAVLTVEPSNGDARWVASLALEMGATPPVAPVGGPRSVGARRLAGGPPDPAPQALPPPPAPARDPFAPAWSAAPTGFATVAAGVTAAFVVGVVLTLVAVGWVGSHPDDDLPDFTALALPLALPAPGSTMEVGGAPEAFAWRTVQLGVYEAMARGGVEGGWLVDAPLWGGAGEPRWELRLTHQPTGRCARLVAPPGSSAWRQAEC